MFRFSIKLPPKETTFTLEASFPDENKDVLLNLLNKTDITMCLNLFTNTPTLFQVFETKMRCYHLWQYSLKPLF